MNPGPMAALMDLLLALFSEQELRIFLANRLDRGADIIAQLPGGSSSPAWLADQAVQILTRRGLVTRDLFEALIAAVPARHTEIEEVAEMWRPIERAPLVAVTRSSATLIKILILASNPRDTSRRALDRESRAIDARLQVTTHRDMFRIEQAWAVHAHDIQELLLRHNPSIVHFAGHGDDSGRLLFDTTDASARPVERTALAHTFRILGGCVRCVVLSGCYNAAQARALAKHVDVVLGTPQAFSEQASIIFSSSFYEALGFGRSISAAFDLACNRLALEGVKESKPRIKIRPGDSPGSLSVR